MLWMLLDLRRSPQVLIEGSDRFAWGQGELWGGCGDRRGRTLMLLASAVTSMLTARPARRRPYVVLGLSRTSSSSWQADARIV